MKKQWLVPSMVFLFVVSHIFAEQNVLDRYIALGLKNNLALKQQEFQFEKSMEALKEAKAMFLPSIHLMGRFSRAGGGRVFEIPVGDLINPINTAFNQLYGFHGIDAGLPTNIPNITTPFFLEQEQETKLRLVQPLFHPALLENHKLKSNLSKIEGDRINVYKRHLVMDIKSAYYNYLKILRVLEILDETRALLEENLKISENLVKNGKETENVVFRAKADIALLEQEVAEVEKNRIVASKYFNFLLNRELDSPIETDYDHLLPLPEILDFETALKHAFSHREEFRQMTFAIDAASNQIGLARSNYLPAITAVFDYGFWGEEYRFGKDDDFWMASFVLEWSLFTGGQNKAKKAQAQLDKQRLEVQQKELKKQILLEVQEEYEALKAAGLAIDAAIKQEESAKSNFGIVAKKYEHGMTPQIVYLDAQNVYIQAAINKTITYAQFLIQYAQFERAAALFDLERINPDSGTLNSE
ncbi:MAG: TolC family protein [Candidatus Aminicenantes bacterium]|jgi:outer membrane protein TolC